MVLIAVGPRARSAPGSACRTPHWFAVAPQPAQGVLAVNVIWPL